MSNNEMTPEQLHIAEDIMRSIRPVLRKRVGTDMRGYDTADLIAEAVSRGVRRAVPAPVGVSGSATDRPEDPAK